MAEINMITAGCAADGVTDDSSTIQTTINNASAGDTFYFPAGSYICHEVNIVSKNNLTFRGDGPTSIIKWLGTGSWSDIWTAETSSGHVIKDLAFDMNAMPTFGGIRYYAMTDVDFYNCKFYDSNPVAPDSTDRYAILFGVGASTSKDVAIRRCHFTGLQVELDHIERCSVTENTSIDALATCAFGCFSVNNSTTINQVEFVRNIVINPRDFAGAFAVHLDPATNNNCTFRNILIAENVVYWTNDYPPKAVWLGTNNLSQTSTGNVWEDIVVRDNDIVVENPVVHQTIEGVIALLPNNGGSFDFVRPVVEGNRIWGGKIPIVVRRATNGRIVNNKSYNTQFGISIVSALNTTIARNHVQASDACFNMTNSRGGTTFRDNTYQGNSGIVDSPKKLWVSSPSIGTGDTFQAPQRRGEILTGPVFTRR